MKLRRLLVSCAAGAMLAVGAASSVPAEASSTASALESSGRCAFEDRLGNVSPRFGARSNHGLDARLRGARRNRAFGYFCAVTRLRSSAIRAPSSAREPIPSLR